MVDFINILKRRRILNRIARVIFVPKIAAINSGNVNYDLKLWILLSEGDVKNRRRSGVFGPVR